LITRKWPYSLDSLATAGVSFNAPDVHVGPLPDRLGGFLLIFS
jgi:hypothetical protein